MIARGCRNVDENVPDCGTDNTFSTGSGRVKFSRSFFPWLTGPLGLIVDEFQSRATPSGVGSL